MFLGIFSVVYLVISLSKETYSIYEATQEIQCPIIFYKIDFYFYNFTFLLFSFHNAITSAECSQPKPFIIILFSDS